MHDGARSASRHAEGIENMATYSQMLKEVQAMTKRAQAKLAEISGEDPDNMPGAENDKDVTLPKEDPEVNDGSMGPASTRSTEGKGDDRPITAGDLFESDESIVNPEEKPLETADANAKEASAKNNTANDILNLIHGAQTKKEEKKAEVKKEEKKDEKKAEAKKPAAEPAKQPEQKKEAATPGLNLELTTDVLAKLACAMLAEKEGADIAERVMAKQAGAEKAAEIMDYLAGQEKAAEEYMAGQRAAVAYVMKQAQDLGSADADAAIAAMAAEAPEAAPEEVAPAADAPAAEEDPAAAADEGMLPEDAVAEVLLSQLQSGDLTEDDLVEIVQELAAEEPAAAEELGLDLGVEGGEPEAAPAEDGAAAEPEAEPADDAEKAASAKKQTAKKPVKKQASFVEKRAALMSKIAVASKLLVAHLGK